MAAAPVRLIVRGDDMGSSHASNLAAIRCYREGVMRDVEVMAVGPWFPEAARLLRENPGLDVGLHLALTSEWDNVKWRPLDRQGVTDAWTCPQAVEIVEQRGIELIGYRDLASAPTTTPAAPRTSP